MIDVVGAGEGEVGQVLIWFFLLNESFLTLVLMWVLTWVLTWMLVWMDVLVVTTHHNEQHC